MDNSTQDLQVLHGAAVADLGEPQPKPTAVTPGLQERSITVWSGNAAESGIWECDPGTFTAVRDGYSETCFIISGRVTVTSESGDEAQLSAGDVIVMPEGWQGTWTVHERVRKHYTLIFHESEGFPDLG